MDDTGLVHAECGGRFLYLPEPLGGTACDVVCEKCELHTGIDTEFLGFCGCGDPEGVLLWVLGVLEAFKDRSDENRKLANAYDENELFDTEAEEFRSKAWSKNSAAIDDVLDCKDCGEGAVKLFVLYQIDNLGLLEHGTSIGGSWLTDLGEKVLAAIQNKPWWQDYEDDGNGNLREKKE